jgi:hypothetical protein
MESREALYRLKGNPEMKRQHAKQERYWGANIGAYEIPGDMSGKKHWYMSTDESIKATVVNVEIELDRVGKELAKKVSAPMTSGYRPRHLTYQYQKRDTLNKHYTYSLT